jgi:hypothetical protein
MTIRPRQLTLAALLALCCVSVQAQQASTLQQRMSSSEFKAAGLDKLSPQELQSLDGWLASHGKVVTKVVDAGGKPVFYPDEHQRRKISTHITGHFDGWHGSSQFTLDNGQVWKQIGADMPSCMSTDHPAVKIKPSLMGNWLMYVDGCNDTVHVQRVH